jgi:MFS family permease
MIARGLLTIGASYSKNYATLVVCRVLIAAAESLIQGAVLYLSFWYRYEELATRASVLSATNALAGAFSGLLAYAIQKDLDGHNSRSAKNSNTLPSQFRRLCASRRLAPTYINKGVAMRGGL